MADNTTVTEVVSPSGATTTTFVSTPPPPATPAPVEVSADTPPPEPTSTKTTVIVTHSEVNDAFVNWLEATGAVLSSIVTSIAEVLGKPDEVKAREDYIRIIMSVKGVDEAEAENLYQKFLQEKRQKTPGYSTEYPSTRSVIMSGDTYGPNHEPWPYDFLKEVNKRQVDEIERLAKLVQKLRRTIDEQENIIVRLESRLGGGFTIIKERGTETE